jgi:hypothetical protein
MPNTRWYPNLRDANQDLSQAIRRILDFIYELRDELSPRALYTRSTEDHTIFTSTSAVKNCSLALQRPGKWLVTGCSTITVDGDAGKLFTLALRYGAAHLLPFGHLQAADATICTITQQWEVHVATESTVTLELFKESTAVGTSIAYHPHTTLSAVWGGAE